ncbi:MAG: 6,7-dimethyl-8-ribityllumazine synthase [Fimbriimonadaceae bacterium]|nr:6,7-dimethyl-8-ribityllumazine synthase [Fimbriimonadaceae bacterium]
MQGIGSRIRSLREAREPRLRQVDLARSLGLTKDEMWNIENGRTEPSARLLAKIAKELGVSVEELARPGAPAEPAGKQVEAPNDRNRVVAIVVSRWNEFVTRELRHGAEQELARSGCAVEVFEVPGAWELPVAVAALLRRGAPPSAVVALGCILQGETPHARQLASDVASSLMRLQVEHGVPVAWGVLTPDTPEQAIDRAGMKLGNKGREAALAALAMIDVLAAAGR